MAKQSRTILAVAAAFLLPMLVIQCAEEPEQANPSKEIIDKYFAAIGGKERIEAVDNLFIGGYYQHFAHPVHRLNQRPNTGRTDTIIVSYQNLHLHSCLTA